MNIKNEYKGIFYIVLSAFCFAVMNMFVRMAGDLPSIQKSFFRNLVAVVFAGILLIRGEGGFRWQKRSNAGYFFLRSLFGTLGILCNFYAVDHLVLADASMLNKMSPFFAVLFSFLILKEKVAPAQVFIILGCIFRQHVCRKADLLQSGIYSVPDRTGRGNLCGPGLYDGQEAGGKRGKRPVYRLFFLGVFLHCNTAVAAASL